MDEIDGSDNVVLVDKPVFYLSGGAPQTSLLLGLAGAEPTFYTSGYHDHFLSVCFYTYSYEKCTARIFLERTLTDFSSLAHTATHGVMHAHV